MTNPFIYVSMGLTAASLGTSNDRQKLFLAAHAGLLRYNQLREILRDVHLQTMTLSVTLSICYPWFSSVPPL
jgi:hypothetical protein